MTETPNHEHLHADPDGEIVSSPCADPGCPMRWCSHGPAVNPGIGGGGGGGGVNSTPLKVTLRKTWSRTIGEP